MATIKPAENIEDNPRVKAVFDDIMKTRNSDFINNLWIYIAVDEDLLESTWADVKRMTDNQYAELIKIVSLAAKTNHIANGLQIPIDDVFELDKE